MSLPPNLSVAELATWLQAQVERRADARLCEVAEKIAAIRSSPPVVPIPAVLPLSSTIHQTEPESPPIVKIRPSVAMPEGKAQAVSCVSITSGAENASTITYQAGCHTRVPPRVSPRESPRVLQEITKSITRDPPECDQRETGLRVFPPPFFLLPQNSKQAPRRVSEVMAAQSCQKEAARQALEDSLFAVAKKAALVPSFKLQFELARLLRQAVADGIDTAPIFACAADAGILASDLEDTAKKVSRLPAIDAFADACKRAQEPLAAVDHLDKAARPLARIAWHLQVMAQAGSIFLPQEKLAAALKIHQSACSRLLRYLRSEGFLLEVKRERRGLKTRVDYRVPSADQP